MKGGMIPIISILGRSNTGKTTLIEKLVPEIRRRGYRVATIKHAAGGFEIDRKGKDSWRHKKAGAYKTILVSPTELALMEVFEREYSVEELVDLYIKDADIVLLEGHKNNPYPRIEMLRKDVDPLPRDGREHLWIAVVGDKRQDVGIPHFQMDEIQRLADLLENKYLRR
ncbi:MAG: molybdopterin-guanine dinucleotide biosynthesis protein B [Thermodesulfovibrionales bacterium]|jgi:molybdopterin-guanine dinucleotide biosynthesis protein B